MRQAGRSLPEYRAAAVRARSSRPSPTPRSPPSSRSSPCAATASTPPSCSPTSSCRCMPSASASTSSRAGARWWPSRSAAPPTSPACARSSPTTTRPTSPRRSASCARELAGRGVALIGFAGAPFTVASYLIEGGPSRTFAKVKSLMHGEPGAVGAADRPAGRHVGGLAAGPDRGRCPGRPALRQLGRIALARRVRALRPARHPGRPRRASPTSACPTILFGVGTGELLGLMATAGADVVGVDWRVPLDEARRRVGPDHAVQGNLDPALCLAPWPVVEAATPAGAGRGRRRERHRATSSTSATGSCPRPTPGILGAVVDLVHAESARRARTDRSACSSWRTARHEHGGDRALLHPHPPRPAADARAAGRARAALRAPSAASRRSPNAPGHRSTGCAPRSRPRAPGRYVVAFGAKHADPLIEDAAATLPAAGLRRVVGLVLTPHGSSLGRRSTSPGPKPPSAGHAASSPSALVRRTGSRRARGRPRHGGPGIGLAGDAARYRLFTAHSLPERVRDAGDTYPEQLAESAGLVGRGGRHRALGGGLAERRAHARAVAGSRRPRRGAPPGRPAGDDRRGRDLPDRLRGRPSRGALRPRRRAGRRGRSGRAGVRPHRLAQRRPRVHQRPGRCRHRRAPDAG